jgi:hypothetical protein
MRSLLIVDDHKIRLAAYQQTEKLFKKMYRIESDIESFQNQDQRRFEQWSALTFGIINSRISEAQTRVRRLQQMHNWMVALSRMSNISPSKAYRQIKQEEVRYEKGTEIERHAIDELRRKREEYIDRELEREAKKEARKQARREANREANREAKNPYSDDENNFDQHEYLDPGAGGIRRDQTGADQLLEFDTPSGPPRTPEDEILFQKIVSLSNEELRECCENLEDASRAFVFVGRVNRTLREMVQMLRIWEALPQRHRGIIAKKFRRGQGFSIEQLVSRLGQIRDDIARAESKLSDDLDQEMSGDQTAAAGSINEASVEEQIKITYRKLARRLHPDMQTQNHNNNQNQSNNQNQNQSNIKNQNQKKSAQKIRSASNQEEIETAWRKQMWGRVQESYRNRDLKSLTKFLQMTLLRTGALKDLTLSEIEESANWLRGELANLENQAASFKRMPAWRFSSKKDLTPLERKLEKALQKDLITLHGEINDLETRQFVLENY